MFIELLLELVLELLIELLIGVEIGYVASSIPLGSSAWVPCKGACPTTRNPFICTTAVPGTPKGVPGIILGTPFQIFTVEPVPLYPRALFSGIHSLYVSIPCGTISD